MLYLLYTLPPCLAGCDTHLDCDGGTLGSEAAARGEEGEVTGVDAQDAGRLGVPPVLGDGIGEELDDLAGKEGVGSRSNCASGVQRAPWTSLGSSGRLGSCSQQR